MRSGDRSLAVVRVRRFSLPTQVAGSVCKCVCASVCVCVYARLTDNNCAHDLRVKPTESNKKPRPQAAA